MTLNEWLKILFSFSAIKNLFVKLWFSRDQLKANPSFVKSRLNPRLALARFVIIFTLRHSLLNFYVAVCHIILG